MEIDSDEINKYQLWNNIYECLNRGQVVDPNKVELFDNCDNSIKIIEYNDQNLDCATIRIENNNDDPILSGHIQDIFFIKPPGCKIAYSEDNSDNNEVSYRAKTIFVDDPLFLHSVACKAKFIDYWTKYLPKKPSNEEIANDPSYKQVDFLHPTPRQIMKIVVELWEGKRISLMDSTVKYLLSPIHTLVGRDARFYCPFCICSEQCLSQLTSHFNRKHNSKPKRCRCGFQYHHNRDLELHISKCILNNDVEIDSSWYVAIKKSFVTKNYKVKRFTKPNRSKKCAKP